MKQFTDDQLLECWLAVKVGKKKKSEVAAMFNITPEEAVEMFSQAHKLYSRKQSAGKSIVVIDEPAEENVRKPYAPFKRPPAVYDNPSHEDILNKYLNMDI
jgi:hypothetical protein